MPALKRFFVENGVYHTISVTRDRMPVLADARFAEEVVECIKQMRRQGDLLVMAYAVLPDHLHLLCVPVGHATISDVMKSIKGWSAKALNKTGLRSGPLWQQSFYDRVIRDEEHLNATVEYIHRNPVIEGLVTDAREYRFCSAHPEAQTDADRFFGA